MRGERNEEKEKKSKRGRKKDKERKKGEGSGGGGGIVVNVLAFYSDDPSSNPAADYIIFLYCN